MRDQHFLTTHGGQITDQTGQSIRLRGFGLGGWMNMENFITGYPGNEEGQRQALRAVLGEARYRLFFDCFLRDFFTKADAQFIQSLGLNLLRLPINYRHFEDDARPFEIQPAGFEHLDRVIELCAQHGIYTVIDLHAAQGYQNPDWICDNPTHRSLLWQHRQFQDRVVHLWETLAARYRNHPWIAGYDLLNEPADPNGTAVRALYTRLVKAVRAIDPDHILFIEGNSTADSLDFDVLEGDFENLVYSPHDYPMAGFAFSQVYPGITLGTYYDKETIRANLLKKCAPLLQKGVPIWIGEFGPVYSGEPTLDAMRYQLLRDQIATYEELGMHWAIWTYKDVGVQGVVYATPESAWMSRLASITAKKRKLTVDAWGMDESEAIRRVLAPLRQLITDEFPQYTPYPFGADWQVQRIIRQILLAEPLVLEYAALFAACSEADIRALMASFQFEQCMQRSTLAAILAAPARAALDSTSPQKP